MFRLRSLFGFRTSRIIALAVVTGATALVMAGMAAPVHAGKDDYKRVINLAGNQLMLLEKMSKEMMLIALEYQKENNLKSLKASHELFDRTLWGLRDGDRELLLPQTTKPAILQHLTLVEDLWPPFDDVIRFGIQTREVRKNFVDALGEINPPLRDAMQVAVTAYVDAATKGELHSLLAVAINVAGRQRTLIQKMSKEFLLIAYGHEVEANKQNLVATYSLFDRSLLALVDGDMEQKLFPAPNLPIKSELRKVQRLWDEFLPLMMSAARTGRTTPAGIAQVARKNLTLLGKMNEIVLMYEAL